MLSSNYLNSAFLTHSLKVPPLQKNPARYSSVYKNVITEETFLDKDIDSRVKIYCIYFQLDTKNGQFYHMFYG